MAISSNGAAMADACPEQRIAFVAQVTDMPAAAVRAAFADAVALKVAYMNDEAFKSAQMAEDARHRSHAAAIIWFCAVAMTDAAMLPGAAVAGTFLVAGIWAAGWWGKARDERARAQAIVESGLRGRNSRAARPPETTPA